VKESDLYVPLTYNDGTLLEAKTIERIGQRLLEQFGGATFFPQSNQGLWRMGSVTFRDQIVIFRVLSANVRGARRFFRALKQELKTELEQEEILVVERRWKPCEPSRGGPQPVGGWCRTMLRIVKPTDRPGRSETKPILNASHRYRRGIHFPGARLLSPARPQSPDAARDSLGAWGRA
jgi:hypothetical protein